MSSIKEELKRLVGLLPQTDPRTLEYHTLLQSIEVLSNDGVFEAVSALLEEPDTTNLVPLPSAKAEKPKAEDPAPEAAPEPEADAAPDETNYPVLTPEQIKTLLGTEDPSKEQVRGYLAEAKLHNGFDLKPFLQQVGAKNLSAIDPALYPALLYYAEHEMGNV